MKQVSAEANSPIGAKGVETNRDLGKSKTISDTCRAAETPESRSFSVSNSESRSSGSTQNNTSVRQSRPRPTARQVVIVVFHGIDDFAPYSLAIASDRSRGPATTTTVSSTKGVTWAKAKGMLVFPLVRDKTGTYERPAHLVLSASLWLPSDLGVGCSSTDADQCLSPSTIA